MKKTKRRLPPSLRSVAIDKRKINTLPQQQNLSPQTDHRPRARTNLCKRCLANRQEMIMRKTAHDRPRRVTLRLVEASDLADALDLVVTAGGDARGMLETL